MSAFKNYNKEVLREYGYRATWGLGTNIEVGMVGTFVDGVFRQESTLENYGITDMQVKKGRLVDDYNFESKRGVDITFKASGDASPANSQLAEAEAGFSIHFDREFSVVFRTHQAREIQVQNAAQIGQQIIKLYEEGKWDRDFVVVTNVVQAKAATIIISGEKGGHIDISAKGKATVSDIDLANLSADLDVKWSSKIEQKMVAKKGATPLFRIHGIKKGWFRGGKFRAIRDVNNPGSLDGDGWESGFGFAPM